MYKIEDIKKMIPHRYPFLLVDRVTEVEVGKRIVGYKNLTANEEFFQGHYPGMPIMPGVLIIEAMAQMAAILGVLSMGDSEDNVTPIFRGIDNAKFKRMVVPGDRLNLTLTLTKSRRDLWQLTGEADVDGEIAARAEIQALLQRG